MAAEIGIEEVHAQVLPQDKAARVRAIQSQDGARVVMAGDGINDAPALMQADIGIAIGAGTDIAIESSDVIVMGERVGAIMEARAIGALSYRKTLQNLILAFLFNGVGVPLAATGVVHPAWAMIAMAVSVSAVLANSFGGRLLKRRDAEPRLVSTTAPPEEQETSPAETELVLDVPTIHCQGCVDTIAAYLMTEEGIDRVEGDPESKAIRVSYRPDMMAPDAIETAINRLGHKTRAA